MFDIILMNSMDSPEKCCVFNFTGIHNVIFNVFDIKNRGSSNCISWSKEILTRLVNVRPSVLRRRLRCLQSFEQTALTANGKVFYSNFLNFRIMAHKIKIRYA